jgi:hypothetical protein
MSASYWGHTDTVRVLLEARADKEAQSKVRENKKVILVLDFHIHICGCK